MLELHLKGVLTKKQVEETARTLHEMMKEEDLLADMEPRQEGERWFLSLSEEDGDTEDFVYFDSEEQAERVADRLMELIEADAED